MPEHVTAIQDKNGRRGRSPSAADMEDAIVPQKERVMRNEDVIYRHYRQRMYGAASVHCSKQYVQLNVYVPGQRMLRGML